jgi:hypothetical protein
VRELKRAAKVLGADAEAAPAGGEEQAGPAAPAGKAQQRAKKADDYHARHRDWVAQFNELTQGECAGGASGVQWAAVRAWQQKHWQANNLLADGLIGPKTLEAARIVAKQQKGGGKGDEKPEAKAAEAAPEGAGKDPAAADDKQAAPQPGQAEAEAAEASADKPQLDESEEKPADAASPENGPADSDAKLPGQRGLPIDAKGTAKPPTLLAFDQKLEQIEQLLSQFKPPEGQGALPQSALAQANGSKEKDPTKQADPAGEMMNHLSAYRGAVAKLVPKWQDLSPEKRAHALLEALNHVLGFEQVYPVKEVVLGPLSGADGMFTPLRWKMTVSEQKFTNGFLKPPQIENAASDVFHEGRHAEQRFSVARLMAGQGLKSDKIAEGAGIDEDAAKHAIRVEKAHPLTPNSPEEKDAKAFSGDTVAHGDEHRAIEHLAAVISALGPEARTMFDGLTAEDRAATKGRWEAVRARMYQVIDAYQRLATEKDAFAAEEKLGLKK